MALVLSEDDVTSSSEDDVDEEEEESFELKGSVWGNLPAELLERILKDVPFSNLNHFREVCKRWNSLITYSTEFIRTCQQPESSNYVPILLQTGCVDSRNCFMVVYKAKNEAWETRSLSFLGDAVQGAPLWLTASSGGLLCYETENRQNFIICNPLTRQWKQLTRPHDASQPNFRSSFQRTKEARELLTGLVVNSRTGNYKLIMASVATGADHRTLVYDSSSGSWSTGAEVPRGKRFLNPWALTCNGNLYCLLKNADGSEEARRSKWSVLKYDVDHDSWRSISTERVNILACTKLELVESQGHLLLVARVPKWRWLAKKKYMNLWYNSFYRVWEESPTDRRAPVREWSPSHHLLHDIRAVGMGMVDHPGLVRYTNCFTGTGDRIYVSGIPDSELPMVEVKEVDTLEKRCKPLPCWHVPDPAMRMEIRILQPTRTIIL